LKPKIVLWLVDIFEFNLYLALNRCKGDKRIIWMNIARNNQTSKSKTKFGLNNKISFNDMTFQEIGLLKTWSISHCEENQWCRLLASKFASSIKIHYVFHISLLEPYHTSIVLGKNHEPPSLIEINGEQKYTLENIIDSRTSNG
jgi:hypothetical protein